jgi:glycosyltransferase involved in cell wall biosynthesis
MGEHIRALYRALSKVGASVAVRDVYALNQRDPSIEAELGERIVQDFGRINIFCLNGDEIEPVFCHMRTKLPNENLNIVYPAWELTKYPHKWAVQLEKFDEVWTASRSTHAALDSAVHKPVIHLPLPGEIAIGRLYGRRHFSIPEHPFVFLFFFDFTSYVDRKNPFAVLRAFELLLNKHPDRDLLLLIKAKGGGEKSQKFLKTVEKVDRVMTVDGLLTEDEIRSLVWCSDCFISLHRAEGFGFGLSSAMFLEKPVIATGFSGNLDYMTKENSYLVPYTLCPVPEGGYPYWEGQVWADPDVQRASTYMEDLILHPVKARQMGAAASRHIRALFSYRACGLRYLARINSRISNGQTDKWQRSTMA